MTIATPDLHLNGSFPSDTDRFAGEARYNPNPVSAVHGNPSRHISAPRVDRARSTMTAPRRDGVTLEKVTTVAHRRPAIQKFEAKGHDAALSHCQNHGLVVEVQTLTSDVAIKGTIARRDRFTVTMERESPVKPGWVYHEIIYKHAIESIRLPEFNKSEVH